ncbi:ATP-binding protein [Magnetovibrio sp. PR-2]|uniref:ATP-binding protein n=1 Tax=Magnetovibrio sp. PR-2 TaxID=3120356 RepID=UPI002FCDEEC3
MDVHGHRGEEFYNRGMNAVLDVLNRVQDVDALVQAFVETVLEVLDCDRVFLLTPLDPGADTFRIAVEATKPDYPGALETGLDFPLTPFHEMAFQAVLNADGVIIHSEKELANLRDFKEANVAPAKSAMICALYPRIGKPWMFGLHQCRYERQWSPNEQKLFQDFAARLSESLSNRLLLSSLQESERTLKVSEERLRMSQEIAHVGTWDMVVANLDMVWSQELFDILGYDANVTHPSFDALMSCVDDRDVDRVRATINNAMRSGGNYDIQHRIRYGGDDGPVRTVRQTGRIYRDASQRPYRLISVVQDCTDQLRTEHRLNAFLELNKDAPSLSENEILSRALDIAVEATASKIGYLHLVGEDQNTLQLTVWNEEARKLCTASHTDHYPIDEAGVWADAVRRRMPVVHNEYEALETKKGYPEGHFPVHRHMSAPVLDGDLVRMIIGVGNKQEAYGDKDVLHLQRAAQDIQKIVMRKRTEIALESKTLELQDAIKSVNAADKAKSAFLANMSHELRTPLNSIIGFSQLMEYKVYGELSERYHEYTHLISASGQHLLETINQILDLSKIEAGKLELDCRPADINAIITECVDILDALAKDNAVDVITDISEDHEMTIDPLRMKQVMFNIIGNAIKFTHGGTVCITIDSDETAYRINVTDTGVGMTKEQAKIAMQPFQQAHGRAYTRRSGGTGLGLSLAQKIMELHGGTIELSSEVDAGTRVCLVLPRS